MDTRKHKGAIKEAFSRHTNWANIARELRIDRPLAAPVFKVNGRSITSGEEAITAIARHSETIYAESDRPMCIPPWDRDHGIRAIDIDVAVGMTATAAKKGEATDASGLSNVYITGLREDAISCITGLIQGSGKTREGNPAHWKTAHGAVAAQLGRP